MTSFNRKLVFCAGILCIGNVMSINFRFQKYHYDPWTGRTSSVEEFDNDVRNMDSPKLSQYMNELRRVKNGLEDLRRESKILERELGFGLGGFPSLMDNSENIIKHAFDSVTDQLQQQIGQQINSSQLGDRQKFDAKVKTADRPTLQRNLERLQQTKRELIEAKQRGEALRNELGFDFEDVPGAMQRAETAVDYAMHAIHQRLQQLDYAQTTQANPNQNSITNTMKKVEDVLRTADKQKLAEVGNEFCKMKQYMDNVKAQLDKFHKEIGFEFDGVLEPFKMAETILDYGLNSITAAQGNRQSEMACPTSNQQNQASNCPQGECNQQNLGGSQ